MEIVWLVSLIAVWGVVLVNLLLTLRVVRWLRGIEEVRKLEAELENIPELPVGEPAPNFRTKTLSGEQISLADYAGRAVVFVFVSPRCGSCRQEMPMFTRLGSLAEKRMGVKLILVSDQGTAETHTWIEAIREEDEVDVTLTILVAPHSISDLLINYNPRGLTPYFCYIDEQGTVQAREPVGAGEWSRLRQEWEGPRKVEPFLQSPSRYQ